ncbi:MAG TPA: hypothetical protein VLV86_22205 [Vicinamibacterales bacterium]|nr:hypothetical protein [Vicinamibacterales bacterium]
MRTRLIGALFVAGMLVSVLAQPRGSASDTPVGALPRRPDGKPDFSGIWQIIATANWNILPHQAQPGVPAGQGVVEGNDIPYQPWALAKQKENFAKRATLDPEGKCDLPGVPRVMYLPLPFQIMQVPTKMVMLFEYAHAIRHIYTNGNAHPPGHIDWWLGDSRGRWDGDTFEIDSVDFNDETWFDRAGNFHSDELHVVERMTLVNPDLIAYDVTIEDPKVFTRPWKMHMPIYRRKEANVQLLEYECYAFDWEKYYPYPGL